MGFFVSGNNQGISWLSVPPWREGHRFDSGILHTGKPIIRWAFFMHFYVYIIHSPSTDRFYIGHAQDLENRLFRHRNSGSKATKFANDWILVYSEGFKTRSEAVSREKYIKSRKSKSYIQHLIVSAG